MGMRIFNYFWEKIKISICRPPTRFCSFVEMQIIKNELRLVCQQEIASNDKAENADSKLCSYRRLTLNYLVFLNLVQKSKLFGLVLEFAQPFLNSPLLIRNSATVAMNELLCLKNVGA